FPGSHRKSKIRVVLGVSERREELQVPSRVTTWLRVEEKGKRSRAARARGGRKRKRHNVRGVSRQR
ncbi:hypothetical protein HK405_013752, partial [Cladochytrium tenue]